ncbi:hypothetical protein C7N43_05300 [Sphingobacteriales bacterium UPWRP_1]|nr:hypothetical protein BVG80_09790 [Sphingobacteriales bacterium TSM_CSM]PSJ78119.1 hypothetical protein C7N43_05300 [Sphingobacteriales bacterium UPWRP_1]
MKQVIFLIFLFCLLYPATFAQKHNQPKLSDVVWSGEERIAKAGFGKHALNAGYQIPDIQQYLFQTIGNLQTAGAGLQFVLQTQSPVGRHFHFIQTYENIPVYGTQILVTVDKSNTIGLVTENTYDLNLPALKALKPHKIPVNAKALMSRFAQENKIKPDSPAAVQLFFITETQPVLAVQFKGWTTERRGFFDYLTDTSGNLLYHRDLQNYSGPKKTAQTETASALVFNPNPVTTAHVVYGQGGKYKDNQDADAAELTAELKNTTIEVTFEDGVYKLENAYAKIAEFDNPVILPVTSTLPQFNFTRSDDGFEDVNAFYHINAFQQYLQNLGFNLVQTQVQIDTHGKNGDDQSLHIYNNGSHQLIFGSGHSVGTHHVDDAEDADVVVHEYGHAVSASACPNCNSGLERTAIDEAVCDYLATSYKREIDSYNWQNMFSWDGHNEFWDGRNVASNKHYPEDNKLDIYYRSEIFSSVLMQIWDAIGKEASDKIVISALYQFSSGISMETAANILLYVDNQLYGGQHVQTLQSLLQQRGLLEYQANAGPDFSVCLGETVILGVPNAPPAPEGVNMYWSPGLTLNDSTLANPTANPDRPTVYTLYLVDKVSNIAYTDEAFVDVAYCFNNPPGNDIRLLNTDRFFKRRGNIILEVPPGTAQVKVSICDTYGRWVKDITNAGDDRLEISGDDMPPGIYQMLVEADGKKATFTIGRVR